MTSLVVAKKDFGDAVQSRALWSLVAVFVVVSTASTYAYVEIPELFGTPGGATFAGLVFFTVGLTGLFVPLAAIVVCYRSIAGERELGSIKLLMSLPTTRRDVFVGKVLGRAAVLAFGVGVGAVVGLGFGAVLLGTVDARALVVFTAVTLLFAAVYAGIVVSISAATASTSRATTLALGFFVLFELVWDVVPVAVVYVIEGFSLPRQFPDWVYLVAQLSPSAAYLSSIVALLPDLADSVGAAPGQGAPGEAPAAADAVYVTPEVGLVVLAFWLVVPLAVGYRRFDRADL